MPPWHADPAHGEFVNDRRLSAAEKDTILQVGERGAPEGNAADLPPAPVYPGRLEHRQARRRLRDDRGLPGPGERHDRLQVLRGADQLHRRPVDSGLRGASRAPPSRRPSRDRLRAAAAPAQRRQPPAAPRQRQRRRRRRPRRARAVLVRPGHGDPEDRWSARPAHARPRRTIGRRPQAASVRSSAASRPGRASRVFTPGTAMKLPAGSTLIFQMHYTANGKPRDRPDQDWLRLREGAAEAGSDHRVARQPELHAAGRRAEHARRRADDVQSGRDVWSLLPHTHVRGRRWEVEATYPDGRNEVVLAVPKYDFNWQTDYVFKEPLKLPKGTVLRTSAWYDNSPANKSNPDPKVDVHWGEQTWEEMQFTAFTFTLDRRRPPRRERSSQRDLRRARRSTSMARCASLPAGAASSFTSRGGVVTTTREILKVERQSSTFSAIGNRLARRRPPRPRRRRSKHDDERRRPRSL